MNAEQCLSQFQITTRVGHQVIAPGEGAVVRIMEAAEAAAKSGRLPGLADDLNPAVLDAAKVKAFLHALPKVPEENLERLRERIL
jgi:polyphosphate kinase 2 (PPK2 family)